jgi:hypothetical protein
MDAIMRYVDVMSLALPKLKQHLGVLSTAAGTYVPFAGVVLALQSAQLSACRLS